MMLTRYFCSGVRGESEIGAEVYMKERGIEGEGRIERGMDGGEINGERNRL